MKRLACLALLLLALTACIPATPESATITVQVFFLDQDMFAVGTEPYEKAVSRTVTASENRLNVVLDQLFLGPTAEEQAQGLTLVLSGTTGYSGFNLDGDGVAHVYLEGECNSGGSTYTIGNLIFANLMQFSEVKWIKIYDQNGETETPDGLTSSIPFCLEP